MHSCIFPLDGSFGLSHVQRICTIPLFSLFCQLYGMIRCQSAVRRDKRCDAFLIENRMRLVRSYVSSVSKADCQLDSEIPHCQKENKVTYTNLKYSIMEVCRIKLNLVDESLCDGCSLTDMKLCVFHTRHLTENLIYFTNKHS